MATATRSDLAGVRTLADLADRLDGISPKRIRFSPLPGEATARDVARIRDREGRLCELIDGVLVEKPMGYAEARLAAILVRILGVHVREQGSGVVVGPD